MIKTISLNYQIQDNKVYGSYVYKLESSYLI